MKKKSLHELPNSTSNINDIHEAYFHFENKRHAIQESTHVNQERKEKVSNFLNSTSNSNFASIYVDFGRKGTV